MADILPDFLLFTLRDPQERDRAVTGVDFRASKLFQKILLNGCKVLKYKISGLERNLQSKLKAKATVILKMLRYRYKIKQFHDFCMLAFYFSHRMH